MLRLAAVTGARRAELAALQWTDVADGVLTIDSAIEGGLALVPGMFIVVGNEDADPAVAEVVSIDERGIVLVKVLPGTLEENSFRLRPGYAPAS